MKILSFPALSLLFLLWPGIMGAQQRPVTPDINKMMSMTPAELAKYKEQMLKQASAQIKDIAAKSDIKIDETILPDFEIRQPDKDLRRLAMVPIKTPTRIELMAGVQQSRRQLEEAASPAVVKEVKEMEVQQTGAQLEKTSIALWYQDRPVEALLVSTGAVQKNPDEIIGWNNLAALFNMAGLEEKAIPILMHHLGNIPDNTLLLNNIGQSFLGLGDMQRAKEYFQKCLSIDELNPEANRSMGMISYFEKEYVKAQSYFEKELEVAHRRSTLALLKRKGIAIDLSALRKRRTGIPHRDFFEEINLGSFRMPDLPTQARDSRPWWDEHANYMLSLQAEMLFWMNAGEITDEMRREEGRNHTGIYSSLVDELVRDLGNTFTDLTVIGEAEGEKMKAMGIKYYEDLRAAVCPQPPNVPGQTAEVFEAYARKCCDLHTPIVDNYMAARNTMVSNRFSIVNARWKEYINALISVVQLDPTIGRKKMVYHMVSQYFSFLITTVNTAASFEDPPEGCLTKMTTAQADEVIAANHNIDISCPKWLNIDIDLQVAKLKADCSKYAIEGGKGLLLGYEKNFKTGTSTVAAGMGAEQKFGNLAKVGVKQMVYISFDNNNEFSDFGLKGAVEGKVGLASEALVVDGIGKVGTTVAGVEGGYSLGINSGFKAGVKGKGLLSGVIK
jgi:tetratricopeptide (TPR) repeat protein